MNLKPSSGERSEPAKISPKRESTTRPPLHTLLVEVVGWTMDRSADIPKSQRFTFGQRLDGLTLDALLLVTQAVFASEARIKSSVACLSPFT